MAVVDMHDEIGDGELQLMRPQSSRLVARREVQARAEVKQDIRGLRDDDLAGLEKRRRIGRPRAALVLEQFHHRRHAAPPRPARDVDVIGAGLFERQADEFAAALAAARAQPGILTLASIGPATVSHLTVERLKLRAKADIIFVPYPGYSPGIEALLGSHVTAALADYSSLVEHIKAGKLRALATTMPARIEQLPDVPTVAESGYKDFVAEFFVGLIAPAKTPKDTVAQIGAMFTAAMQPPDIKAKLAALGLFPNGTCGADFAAILRKDYEEYGRVIREANIKME